MPSQLSATVSAVVESLRAQIRSGNLRSGGPLPAEMDLAASLSVSRGTVRRAIDVLVEQGELHRRPHSRPVIPERISAPMRTSGSEIHIWISRKIADLPALHMLRGVSQNLAGSGCRMIVREPTLFIGEVVECEERQFLLDLLNATNAIGAIVERDPFRSNADLLERLTNRGMHLVFVDTPPPAGIEADHVGTANTASARRCVQHLIELGHRDITCVIDTETPRPIQDRVKGYWRAMRQANLESHGRVLVGSKLSSRAPHFPLRGSLAENVTPNPDYMALGQQIVHEVLSMRPRPTALFVAYDVLAYLICAFLEGAGVRVPDDISVVGFDWKARPGEPLVDRLTTASQDFEGFGRFAVDLLLDRIADGGSATPRHVLLDAPLVVRSTTAPLHLSAEDGSAVIQTTGTAAEGT